MCDTPLKSEMNLVTRKSIAAATIYETWYFRTYLPIHVVLVLCVQIYQWPQFRTPHDAFMSYFLIMYFCVTEQERFTLNSVWLLYCLCVSLSCSGYVPAHAFRCNYGYSQCSLLLFQVCTRHSRTPGMFVGDINCNTYVVQKNRRKLTFEGFLFLFNYY